MNTGRGNWRRQYQETPEECDRVRHRNRSYQRGGNWGNGGRPSEGSESGTRDSRGFGSHQGEWFSRGKGKPPRRGHPQGLKGKEIGLWYASKSKHKSAERDRKQRAVVDIDRGKVECLSTLLSSIRGYDLVNDDDSEVNASVGQESYLPSSKDRGTKRNPFRTSTETGEKQDWFLSSPTDTEIKQKRFSTPAAKCEMEQDKYSSYQKEKRYEDERYPTVRTKVKSEYGDTSLASCEMEQDKYSSYQKEKRYEDERYPTVRTKVKSEYGDTSLASCEMEQDKYSTFQKEKRYEGERYPTVRTKVKSEYGDPSLASCEMEQDKYSSYQKEKRYRDERYPTVRTKVKSEYGDPSLASSEMEQEKYSSYQKEKRYRDERYPTVRTKVKSEYGDPSLASCEMEQDKYSSYQKEKRSQEERYPKLRTKVKSEYCDPSLASCSHYSENRFSGGEETLIKDEYQYKEEDDDDDYENDDDDDDDDECWRKLAEKSEKLSDADFGVYDDDDLLEDLTELPQVSEMFKYREEESDFMFEYRLNKEGNRRSRERLSEIEKRAQPEQDHVLDRELLEKQKQKESNSVYYKRMLRFRQKLPSYQMRQEIIDLIKTNQVVVISGETGCGKTTQVSQFILDDYIQHGLGSMCRVVCTQPRRISAISVADRVADERAERCGEDSVGYQIRLEHKLPRKRGSILYCTTGILMKWLVDDPWLSSTSHVILDEIHERDLQSDFLMIILKDLLLQRKDLKLVLMSATLNAELFSQYFRNCPMTNIPGYTFPVKEYLVEDIVELTRYLHNQPPMVKKKHPGGFGRCRRDQRLEMQHYQNWCDTLRHRYSRETIQVLKCFDPIVVDLDLMVTLIEYICRKKQDGAILVFQPGWDQIKSLHDKLLAKTLFKSGKFRIIPLHSQMPTINQKEVFERPPLGVRKIVIATNIAETSITIDDVVYVVDCGKIKMKNFDTQNNIATLKPEWVSRANARQRRGRAGRVQPGECYHLYTSYHEAKLEDYQLPEILRTRLEELCLQIKLLKLGMIEPFVSKAMQPPSLDALHLARQMLLDLNALDANEDLTPLGYHLSKMPVDPHTGKMLLFAAMFSCLDPICTVAASHSFKNAFYIPMGMEKIADQRRRRLSRKSRSDHIMLVNAYQGWERASSWRESKQFCSEHFLSLNILHMLRNMRRQFAELLRDMGFIETANPKCSEANRNSYNHKLIKAVICAGLYPNVAKICRRRNKPGTGRPTTLMTKSDKRVLIHMNSVNEQETDFRSPWLVYHLKMKTSKIFVFDCTEVSPYPLLFFGGAISTRMDQHVHCVAVDNWITFQATKRVASLVKELRSELDRLLEYKIRHPGVTNWDPEQKEGALIRAILDLITTEETRMPGMNF